MTASASLSNLPTSDATVPALDDVLDIRGCHQPFFREAGPCFSEVASSVGLDELVKSLVTHRRSAR